MFPEAKSISSHCLGPKTAHLFQTASLRALRWAPPLLLSAGTAAFIIPVAQAQAADPALSIVRAAVNAELGSADVDHSAWMYRDHDIQPDHDTVRQVIETPKGDLSRLLVLNGHKLAGDEESAELERIHTFVSSPAEQEKKHKDGAHDDAQARELLTMLPVAFTWNIASQNAEETVLRFRPNPDFHPADMQSRVLGMMSGEVVVARNGNRMRTLRGTLTDDVRIGFGILGKLDRGGTFDVERREVGPGHWQITETHVHIAGHALIFKSIGTQEDETKTAFRPSTAPDLRAAEEQITHLP